jgi:hypothetical protein
LVWEGCGVRLRPTTPCPIPASNTGHFEFET